jgi:Flp pilus assembly protein TadD
LLALPAAGCKTFGDDTTGSIRNSDVPRTESDWRRMVDAWGERYKKNPDDPEAALNYARALRATDQRSQAVAVLEQATFRNPNNMALLGDYGRALADAGDYTRALDALGRAHTPDQPDWRILNAEGAVLDQMGRHAEAQRYYVAALKIVPDEPSILSNYGLSYALIKDLKRAEIMLKRAIAQPNADPKIRQNLALIVAMRGRAADAERIAREGVPEAQGMANVNLLRQMLSQQSAWQRNPAPPSGPLPLPGT